MRAAEAAKAPGACGLAEAVARNLFKLMAYKDEYEVARLYADTQFRQAGAVEFDGDKLRFEFHLAPPLLARRRSGDRRAAQDERSAHGCCRLFGVLAKFKVLRGTPFDPFGCTDERRTERKLIADYEAMLDEV